MTRTIRPTAIHVQAPTHSRGRNAYRLLRRYRTKRYRWSHEHSPTPPETDWSHRGVRILMMHALNHRRISWRAFCHMSGMRNVWSESYLSGDERMSPDAWSKMMKGLSRSLPPTAPFSDLLLSHDVRSLDVGSLAHDFPPASTPTRATLHGMTFSLPISKQTLPNYKDWFSASQNVSPSPPPCSQKS